MSFDITNKVIDINFSIPAEHLRAAFLSITKEDPLVKYGGYPWHTRLLISTYEKFSVRELIKGATSIREVFIKLGFSAEIDSKDNLNLVGYRDLVDYSFVNRSLRCVAPYVQLGSRIKWTNSEGDKWTEMFDGKTLTIVDEVILSE